MHVNSHKLYFFISWYLLPLILLYLHCFFLRTQAQDKDVKETNPITKDKQENKDDDEGSESSFHLVSDNEAFKSDQEDEEKNKFKGLSSDEGESKEDEGNEEEKSRKRRRIKVMGSSDEEEEQRLKVKKPKAKRFSKKQ